MRLKGSCLFAQSGGPTSVINASAYGVIKAALDAPEIQNVYAAANGIRGVFNGKIYDITKEDRSELALLPGTPSSAFGSCRHKMKDLDDDSSEYIKLFELFKRYDIRYFFYNGGNDSMDTCNKLSHFFTQNNYECRIMGVPKTIDNDLCGTDHSPGYGSSAKYIANSIAEICLDNDVYDTPSIAIIETMGRHAGWLAGAAGLATLSDAAPDLIYFPEIRFDMDKFFNDVSAIYNQKKKCLIVVSEGIRYTNGMFVADAPISINDGFQHAQLGGVAVKLAQALRSNICNKVRPIELSLLQRCGSHIASKTDMDEAFAVGMYAVERALEGETGKMVIIQRESVNGAYAAKFGLEQLSVAANAEKKIPREWINTEGNFIKQEFIDYALPLIQGEFERNVDKGLPRFAKLKKILA